MSKHRNIFSQVLIFVFALSLPFLASSAALAYDQPWKCTSDSTATLYESIILNDSDCPRECLDEKEECPYKFKVKRQNTPDPNAATAYIQLGDEFLLGDFRRQKGCDTKERNELALEAYRIAKYESSEAKDAKEESSNFYSWIAASSSIPYVKRRMGEISQPEAQSRIDALFDKYCSIADDSTTCVLSKNPVCPAFNNGINNGWYFGPHCRLCNIQP
ncbi:hypothetical protein [Acaryochloris marina]|uniref:hypothetical protein n=1 Tax=Acaryochloris marina TaxID=155978 RepID=UPI0005A01A1C|nr:hypothetical protein [Acaryochloris marina]BDM79645.1 hypothetical protein AM10699_25130 [Acaryochloris marina MBIC10699]